MKKLILILFIIYHLLFTITKSYTQNLTVNIGDIKANKGDIMNVPVNVTGFNNIGAIAFCLKIDTSVITNRPNDSNCVGNIDTLIQNGFMSNFYTKDSAGPTLYIAYINSGNQGINLGDGMLFDLIFLYKKGSAKLCIDTTCSSVVNDTTAPFSVKYTCGDINGINELGILNYELGLKIEPNPSHGKFELRVGNREKRIEDISVYALNGQIIANYGLSFADFNSKSKIPNSQFSENFDLTYLNKGMYLLRILTNDGVSFEKLIIQ